MISVFSNSPIDFRKSNSRPIVVVGVLRNPANTSIMRAYSLRSSAESVLPVLHVGIVARQFGVLGDDAQLLLPRKRLFAIGIPAIVELALVLVGPLLRHVMRRVHRARAEVHEEGLVGRDLFGVGDEADCLVHQILGQVIALFRRFRRLDRMVVVDQLRIVLVACRRPGSRSSARSRAPAASDRTAPPPKSDPPASGATCRAHRCCSRAAAASRRASRSRTECCRCRPG